MTFDWHWPAFFTRVTAGLLFAMAGVYKVFIMTPQVHARKLFLEPYEHTWIPHFLLWSLGLGIPFVESIAGWLLAGGRGKFCESSEYFCHSLCFHDSRRTSVARVATGAR
jgi:hypothetical protein